MPGDCSIGYNGAWNATEAVICGVDTCYNVLAAIFPDTELSS